MGTAALIPLLTVRARIPVSEPKAFGAKFEAQVKWRSISVFKALFGDAIAAPILVRPHRGQLAEDMPAYVRHEGRWYRLDLLRGSVNKVESGSLARAKMIGIPAEVATFFVEWWFTYVEGRGYGARAFLLEELEDPVEPSAVDEEGELLLELEEPLPVAPEEARVEAPLARSINALQGTSWTQPRDLKGKFSVAVVANDLGECFQMKADGQGYPGARRKGGRGVCHV